MGKYALYYLGSLLRKPIGDSGRRILEKSRTGNYFKTGFLPVSPVGIVFFLWGRAVPSITMARPPRGGHFMANNVYVEPTRRLRVVLGPYSIAPYSIALCSHFPYVPISIRVSNLRSHLLFSFNNLSS